MTMSKSIRSGIAALSVAALAGCAGGPISGRLIVPGKAPMQVTITYTSSLFGGSGKLSTLLPDGESYSGKYILAPYAPDDHMVSTLEGDRGDTMTCRFRLKQPGIGPDAGGTGKCSLSTGGSIDATF